MTESDHAAADSTLAQPVLGALDASTRLPHPDDLSASPGPQAAAAPPDAKRPLSPRARLEPERIVPPTRRSKTARHPIIVAGNAVFTLLILVAVVGGALFALVKHRLGAPGPLAADKVVNIPRLGIREIADLLSKEGVIAHPTTFIAAALLAKTREDLKFGEYQFPRRASLEDVINILAKNQVVQHQITIPEGLTSEQVVQRLLETNILAGNIKEIPREGSILPESYRFTRGAPREQVVQRMQQAQTRVVQEIWEHRASDLPLRSVQQLVTLASIVEKETGRADERSRVAAVFVNRLRQRMKLQSDPTIIYGLVGGKGTLGRPISRSEIDQPTPYNTYVIEGLPPGPIANPGRAALEAVANPARTKELYFVADGTGGHAFSETLEQHQRNVARLRALEQSQRDGAAAAASPPPASATSASAMPTPAAPPAAAAPVPPRRPSVPAARPAAAPPPKQPAAQ